jgi:hypothetical protein
VGKPMDERIEAFLKDVLVPEGEVSNLLREGVRRYLVLLYSQKQTSADCICISAKCQKPVGHDIISVPVLRYFECGIPRYGNSLRTSV